MKIGFDIDGTILTPYVKMEKFKEINPNFTLELYDEYPVWRSLEKHGMLPENFDKKAFKEKNREDMLSKGIFYHDFASFYRYLKDKGHEIYFITAREPWMEKYTKNQFEINGIPYKNVYHIGEKSKVPLLMELGIELFYEDNVKVTLDVLENSEIKICLMSRSYNKSFSKTHKRLMRSDEFSKKTIF